MSFVEESKALLDTSANNTYPAEWRDYIRAREGIYSQLLPNYLEPNMRSEAMWVMRSQCYSGEEVGIHVERGDICWMDYGQTFINEMGYQHFGLVVSLWNKKALVIPVTSNPSAYEKAGDGSQPGNHLFRIGMPEGLNRPSTLFMNDIRFVNTARILCIRAHIDMNSSMFRAIQSQLVMCLMGVNEAKYDTMHR